MIRSAAEVLVALEQECLAFDKAIAVRAWSACDEACRNQRRLTHELDIALSALDPASSEYALARKRIDRLTRYRDGQLQRLQALNQSIGKRLTTVQKFRSFAKGRNAERVSRMLDVTT